MVRDSGLVRAVARVVPALVALGFSGGALAHAGHGVADGFLSGFVHPLLGWEHLVAMVAVGSVFLIA